MPIKQAPEPTLTVRVVGKIELQPDQSLNDVLTALKRVQVTATWTIELPSGTYKV